MQQKGTARFHFPHYHIVIIIQKILRHHFMIFRLLPLCPISCHIPTSNHCHFLSVHKITGCSTHHCLPLNKCFALFLFFLSASLISPPSYLTPSTYSPIPAFLISPPAI